MKKDQTAKNYQTLHELDEMTTVQKMKANKGDHGPCPVPTEGTWKKVYNVADVSGFSHGVGGCGPQQGACKLTINVKDGIIVEALVETIGCSGMTHSAAMAGEILPGKTILEALNTDLVCDAINVAMKNLFLNIVNGRTQSAFSCGGLAAGAALEDLGKFKNSQIGTVYSSELKGVRYLELAEGTITKLALDANDEVIGYEFVKTPALVDLLVNGAADPKDALARTTKTYGRYAEGVKFIDPRRN